MHYCFKPSDSREDWSGDEIPVNSERLSSCGLLDAARQSSATHRYHNDSERLSALTLYSAHAPDAMSSCMTSLGVAAARPVPGDASQW